MEKEVIEKRLADLQERQKKLISDIHILEGAIQDCKHWLSQDGIKEEVNG